MTEPVKDDTSREVTPSAGFDFNQPTIVSLCFLASFFTGITGLVGIVLAHVWQGDLGRFALQLSHSNLLVRLSRHDHRKRFVICFDRFSHDANYRGLGWRSQHPQPHQGAAPRTNAGSKNPAVLIYWFGEIDVVPATSLSQVAQSRSTKGSCKMRPPVLWVKLLSWRTFQGTARRK